MNDESILFEVDADQFERLVIRASHQRPVVVDFWAEWCAPCRALGPVLEDVVRAYDGRVALAKLNTDHNPQLAVRYGVRGIPAVKVFRQGQVVREFTGTLPRPEVERIISAVVPGPGDELVTKADQLLSQGEAEKAEQCYRDALEEEPEHPGALLGLGRLALEDGRTEEGEELLARIEQDGRQYGEARALLAGVAFQQTCRRHGGLEACRRSAEDAPEDPQVHYNLGCCLAAKKRYEEALDEFLAALRLDRDYGEGAAREAVLTVFTLAGPQSDLAKTYRRKLASIIY